MATETSEETNPKPLSPGYVTNGGFPAYRKEMEELIAEIQAEREAADNQPDEEA